MPAITFVLGDGSRKEVDASAGESVMRAATRNNVEGIAAECGGCLSCATCHAYIPDDWFDRLPPPSEDEKSMVEYAIDVRPNSRLTCQVIMTEDLAGLVVEVPGTQY